MGVAKVDEEGLMGVCEGKGVSVYNGEQAETHERIAKIPKEKMSA